MTHNNHLTLAVAGSGKTQGIVNECAAVAKSDRVLVLTYTSANQTEIENRIDTRVGDHHNIMVSGWFSFLIAHFVRPYLPFLYRGRHVQGFDFEGTPQMYLKTEDWSRYFNSEGAVYKVHLPQIALRINDASNGVCMRRLEKSYDRVLIDEVQDLCGYDLEVLSLLMDSNLRVEMVGDIRQAILATNGRESKNKKFMYMKIWDWFRAREKDGSLTITQQRDSWRCRPEIAAMADSLFDSDWGFDSTVSRNNWDTNHDGVFLVHTCDVDSYMETFSPMPLRDSASSGKQFDHLGFTNFGKAKGCTAERVLIFPTTPISKFIQNGKKLESSAAAKFYVGITRARQSVAIILDDPGRSSLPYWTPSDSSPETDATQ